MNYARGKQKIAFGKITLSGPKIPAEVGEPTASEVMTPDTNEKEPAGEEEERASSSGPPPPPTTGGGFGSFTFKPPQKKSEPEVELTPEELEMQKTMGFTGFGTSKKAVEKTAKNFDVKEMVEAIKKAKKQQKISKAGGGSSDEDGDNDEEGLSRLTTKVISDPFVVDVNRDKDKINSKVQQKVWFYDLMIV
jgi:hypothetical protein